MGASFGDFVVVPTDKWAKTIESEEVWCREKTTDPDWMIGQRTVDALDLQWSRSQKTKFLTNRLPNVRELP